MSSSTYSSTLTPDARLRSVVVLSGRLLVAAGILLILTMPVSGSQRSAACLAWALWSYRELAQFHSCFGRFSSLRLFADGQLRLLDGNREWVHARLMDGSVLLRKLAWIRIETEDGRRFAELLSGDGRRCTDWRRLQVIWRHLGARA